MEEFCRLVTGTNMLRACDIICSTACNIKPLAPEAKMVEMSRGRHPGTAVAAFWCLQAPGSAILKACFLSKLVIKGKSASVPGCQEKGLNKEDTPLRSSPGLSPVVPFPKFKHDTTTTHKDSWEMKPFSVHIYYREKKKNQINRLFLLPLKTQNRTFL